MEELATNHGRRLIRDSSKLGTSKKIQELEDLKLKMRVCARERDDLRRA